MPTITIAGTPRYIPMFSIIAESPSPNSQTATIAIMNTDFNNIINCVYYLRSYSDFKKEILVYVTYFLES